MAEHFNTNHIPFSEETWLWIKDKITPVIYKGMACHKTIYGDYVTVGEYEEYYQKHRND